jgi:hypothetical protein
MIFSRSHTGESCLVSNPAHQRSSPSDLLKALKADGHCTPPSYSFLTPMNPERREYDGKTRPKMAEWEDSWPKAGLERPIPPSNDTPLIAKIMKGQNLWTTQKGLFASGSYLRQGDIVCVLHGCPNTVALSAVQRGTLRPSVFEAAWRTCKYALRPGKQMELPYNAYYVLGTCYLEGWMDPWSSGKVD